MPILFQSELGDGGWCHIPKAWADLGPKAGLSWCWGSWEGCGSKAAPLGLVVTGPLWMDHSLRILAVPPTPQPSLVHPKNGGPSELEELWNVTWSARLLVVGFPRAASFLRGAPPIYDSTLSIAIWQRLGFVWGGGGRVRGNEKRNTSPWVFLLAHSTLIHNPGTGLALRPLYLSNQSWAGGNAAALWRFPITTTLTPLLMGT